MTNRTVRPVPPTDGAAPGHRADGTDPGANGRPVEMARVPLPTPYGRFEARAFACPSGFVYLALVAGDIGAGDGAEDAPVLTRLHSECLTGDALSSLRCDCGLQLRMAMRIIAAAGRGVLVYATGQEGRGIGLVKKLQAYVEQDRGADTIDANLRLGLAVDDRDYSDAAAVLDAMGVHRVRLLTNNPQKVRGMTEAGVDVAAVEPLATSPHTRNLGYLRTKERRLGHRRPTGEVLLAGRHANPPIDASRLIGAVTVPADRPFVVLKFAQTVDGRIATSTGDARWISGEAERRVSHALRASCDAVLVGAGTVMQDDPQLTVRMVPGASPLRVVLDSTLRTAPDAKVCGEDASTVVLTTERATPDRRQQLAERNVAVRVLPSGDRGVDLAAALAELRSIGVETLLVEGGGRVITSMLEAGVVDRLIVGVAPKIMGRGTDAVGPLGVTSVTDGLRLTNRSVYLVDDDVLLCWDVDRP
jgi:3,4-dihydroxy 2-butanone 4-phosphate synthase/GTP cyclohydrolase II